MLTSRGAAAVASTTLLAVLATLDATVGLSTAAAAVALACGLAIVVTVARGAASAAHVFGAADVVTMGRAMLACGVAALVTDSLLGRPAVTMLVAVATVALLLDAVDGRIARRTRTSAFGGRLDGEVDAFLMLVLSVYVAATIAPWVVLIGAVRYLYAVAGWGLPWLRAALPYRYWRKVVTATQGIVLAVASAGLVPEPVMTVVLAASLLMLWECFARDVVWCWRHREVRFPRRVGAGVPVAVPVELSVHGLRGEQP